MPERKSRPDLLAELIPAVLEAGRAVERIRKAGFEEWRKADHSPVTEADQTAERLLTAAIRKADPGAVIVGEEASADGATPDDPGQRYWLIDPIDGTVAFINGGEDYSVNVGLIENGVPVFGIVYHSPGEKLWLGAQGLGAWVETGGQRTRIRTRAYQTPPLIAVSNSRLGPLTKRWLGRIPDATILKRGASLKLCMLAEGLVDLYPRHGHTSEWDTAAADAILRAAGGTVLGEDMQPLVYGRERKWLEPHGNPPFLAVADPRVIPNLPRFPERDETV